MEKLYHIETTPYVEPTDKEIIDGLDMCGYYEASCRISALKKENANLKRKLTNLQKKNDNSRESR